MSGAGYGAPMGPGAGLPTGEAYAPPSAVDSHAYGAPSAPSGATPRWVVIFFLVLALLPFAGCAACTCTAGVIVGASMH